MPIPTRRFAIVALAAAFGAAVAGSWAGFLAVNLLLVLLLLVDALLAPSPGTIGVERDLPSVLSLDTPATITWRVTNPTDRAVQVALADELAPSLRARARRVALRVPAHRTAEVRTRFRPARRGNFGIRTLAVRVDGPLGLASRQRPRELPAVLRVYPPFASKEEAELRIRNARLLELGLRSAQGRGGGTDFDQLREYTPDDEFRRIDWAATARTARPIVRTYRAERNQIVVNLLDNGRVMAARVADVPKVEHAMDAVMMLTAVATRLGDRAGLVAFDSQVRAVVPPGHGRHQLGVVTEAMYALEPQLAESDYFGAFAETLVRFRRRALLVICTDLDESAMADTLLPAMPLIARSHLVVVAGVVDPSVVAWARSMPTDSEGAYRKAAAVAALEARRSVAARLSAYGATVVDAPPGLLAPRLADAYLKVKATGRL